MNTGAAQTTGTIEQNPDHILHYLICKAYTEACEEYAEGGRFNREAQAAADYFIQQDHPAEHDRAAFVTFFLGFAQGFALGEHAANRQKQHPHDTTHAARLAGGLDEQPGTAKRRATAAKDAAAAIHQCGVYDTDTAAVIYNTVREQRPTYPLEFILGDIYCAGIARGRERERSRIKKQRSPLPEAQRITTNESPADRDSRITAAEAAAPKTKYAPISDADSAAIVYNAARAADPDMPFTFLLGQVYAAGKMEATHAERERRRASAAKQRR